MRESTNKKQPRVDYLNEYEKQLEELKTGLTKEKSPKHTLLKP